MAIKKRAVQQDAAIEAFGNAAEQRDEPIKQSKKHAPTAWAKTILVRYPDDSLPEALAALAGLEERSQHATALRALKRGIEELTREAKQ